MLDVPPETQAMLITLMNAVTSLVIFKIKQYKDRANAADRRADAITEAVDSARADGSISDAEIKRILRVASRTAGVA